MIDINTAFSTVMNTLKDLMPAGGFEAKKAEGLKKDELPIITDGEKSRVEYYSESASIRLEIDSAAKTFSMLTADSASPSDGDFKNVSLWGFDVAVCDERDLKSIANDFYDTIKNKYAPNLNVTAGKAVKMPQTVSKAAAKSGQSLFDSKTLATRFAVMFPEFREDVKENVAKYGDFFPETFFSTIAAPHVIGIIRSRDSRVLKKMFGMFNELYEDGTSEVQGIIAVTILGQMKNDPAMMETADEYMSELLRPSVIEVNKLLGGKSAKKYLSKLENPLLTSPKAKALCSADNRLAAALTIAF